MSEAKRTYVVETYGCQMNVHDSERIAGLLEADGYVPAATPETPTSSWSTPAACASAPRRSCSRASARFARRRRRPATVRSSPWPAASRSRKARRSSSARGWSMSSSARRRSKQLPSLVARAAEGTRAPLDRSAPARGRLVSVRADAPRRPGPRLRHDHRGLQRVLLVLRGPVHARPRADAAGGRNPRGGPPRRRDGPPGSAAARPDRQPLPGAGRAGVRLRGAARARARGRRRGAHPVRQPASAPFHAAHDRRDPRPAEGLQAPPHAGAVRLDEILKAMRRRYSREDTSISSPPSAGRSPASRCPRT